MRLLPRRTISTTQPGTIRCSVREGMIKLIFDVRIFISVFVVGMAMGLVARWLDSPVDIHCNAELDELDKTMMGRLKILGHIYKLILKVGWSLMKGRYWWVPPVVLGWVVGMRWIRIY